MADGVLLHASEVRPRGSRALIAEVAPAYPPLLPDRAEHGPRLAHSATATTVLVRLAELTALVLPMR